VAGLTCLQGSNRGLKGGSNGSQSGPCIAWGKDIRRSNDGKCSHEKEGKGPCLSLRNGRLRSTTSDEERKVL